MKKLVLVSVTSLLIGSVAFADETGKSAAIDEAKSIAQQLGGLLREELVGAMQSGGPVNALQVCNIEAMPLTSSVSEKNGADVSRVSLKNRNPDNLPNEWQRAVLEDFEQRAAEGEPVDALVSTEFVEVDNNTQLRFMKALPTAEACLVCHGQHINSDLQMKLTELYPDDKATGFSVGDIRGAMVVVKNLQQ